MPPRVYVDTNIFIAIVESTPAPLLRSVLRAIEQGHASACTSELTLAEVLVGPLVASDQKRATTYEVLLSSSSTLEIRSVDRVVLMAAAHLRARRRTLKLPDAIHLATAELCGCTIVWSNDRMLEPDPPMHRAGLSDRDLEDLFLLLA